MPNVNQGTIIDKIIKYLEIKGTLPNYQSLSNEKKSAINEGLCLGFSIVHSYMAATRKLEWWKKLLEIASQWDAREESLSTMIDLPGTRENATDKDKTLDALLERVVNYALYNQSQTDKCDIENLNQANFLKPGGMFDSEKGGIVRYANAAGYMDYLALEKILIPEIFGQPDAIFIITNKNHACSIRFDQASKQWCYYNPSSSEGERFYSTLSDMLFVMGFSEMNCNVLSICIASWNPKINTDDFERAYQNLFENEAATLLRYTGLHEITLRRPDLLPKILLLSENNDLIRNMFSKALRIKYADSIYTGLEILSTLDVTKPLLKIKVIDTKITLPLFKIINVADFHQLTLMESDQFNKIIALAETDKDMQKSIFTALKRNSLEAWYAILVNQPNQLTRIIKLITPFEKEHSDIWKSFAKALKYQNEEGLTGLDILAMKVPEQFEALIILAEKHEDVHQSFSAALPISIKKLSPEIVSKALSFAVRTQRFKVADLLLTLADKNIANRSVISSALEESIRYNDMRVTEYLLGLTGEYKPSIDVIDSALKDLKEDEVNEPDPWSGMPSFAKIFPATLNIAKKKNCVEVVSYLSILESEFHIGKSMKNNTAAESQKIISNIIKLDSDGLLQSTIRTLWKETRSSNISPRFTCGKTDAEIMYRAIQEIYTKDASTAERALSILSLIQKFITSTYNQHHPFAVALQSKLHIKPVPLEHITTAIKLIRAKYQYNTRNIF